MIYITKYKDHYLLKNNVQIACVTTKFKDILTDSNLLIKNKIASSMNSHQSLELSNLIEIQSPVPDASNEASNEASNDQSDQSSIEMSQPPQSPMEAAIHDQYNQPSIKSPIQSSIQLASETPIHDQYDQPPTKSPI